jgi:hypothetical protein
LGLFCKLLFEGTDAGLGRLLSLSFGVEKNFTKKLMIRISV